MTSGTTRARRLLGAGCSLLLAAAGLLHSPHHPSRPSPERLSAASEVAASPLAVPVQPPVAPRHRAPSGAIPLGDRPGWRQVLAQDFTGSRLPAGWGTYAGRPGGNPHGWWDGAHVALRGQDLHLVGDWQDGTYTTGGLMASRWCGTYGRYDVRFRVSKAPGVAYALLLWPADGDWPAGGEIDFAEDGGGSRQRTTATLHSGPDNAQVQRGLQADFTRFQTVGVQWTPGRVVYTLNGRPWASVTGAAVPDRPMCLALQLEAGHGTSWSPAPSRATPRTTDLVVDWVVGYRRAA